MESILIVRFKDKVKLNVSFIFGSNPYVIFDTNKKIKDILEKYDYFILEKNFINLSNNKLMNLFNLINTNARVEPGAIIRENVILADDAIVLMGAVINTKSEIGSRTMIDMNAVIGSGAIIKSNCHIGAGVVIAGVMEPVSLNPVVINDNVFIGANAVILEGVNIGANAVIGAGCIVTKDVLENEVVYNKYEVVKKDKTKEIEEKTALNEELR